MKTKSSPSFCFFSFIYIFNFFGWQIKDKNKSLSSYQDHYPTQFQKKLTQCINHKFVSNLLQYWTANKKYLFLIINFFLINQTEKFLPIPTWWSLMILCTTIWLLFPPSFDSIDWKLRCECIWPFDTRRIYRAWIRISFQQ